MKTFFPIFIFALLAFAACNDDDDNNVAVSQTILSYIENKYPGASIRHAEYDNRGALEVEIVHDSQIKDVYFSSSDEWIYTEWDIAIANIPTAVTDAVVAAYPDYRIDDADYIESPSGVYYEIDIEKGNYERLLYVTPEGEIKEHL